MSHILDPLLLDAFPPLLTDDSNISTSEFDSPWVIDIAAPFRDARDHSFSALVPTPTRDPTRAKQLFLEVLQLLETESVSQTSSAPLSLLLVELEELPSNSVGLSDLPERFLLPFLRGIEAQHVSLALVSSIFVEVFSARLKNLEGAASRSLMGSFQRAAVGAHGSALAMALPSLVSLPICTPYILAIARLLIYSAAGAVEILVEVSRSWATFPERQAAILDASLRALERAIPLHGFSISPPLCDLLSGLLGHRSAWPPTQRLLLSRVLVAALEASAVPAASLQKASLLLFNISKSSATLAREGPEGENWGRIAEKAASMNTALSKKAAEKLRGRGL